MTRVLVTPCSSGIGQEIFHSLYSRHDIELYGLDSGGNTPGKSLYGKRFYSGSPLLSDDPVQLREYIRYFCSLHEITHIFPATDDFVNFLKGNEHQLVAKVITSPLETCEVARSKSRTYEILNQVVRVPEVYDIDSIPGFPVFVKPDRGAGSIGSLEIDSIEKLRTGYDKDRDIICELLRGPEYTVDCLTGSDGELLYHCPRIRSIARAGISIVTSRVDDKKVKKQVHDMALNINGSLDFMGAWFFQVKHVENSTDSPLCLLEIAPRIAGAMAYSRISGVNLPLLSLNLVMGLPVRIGNVNHPESTMKAYKTYVIPPLKFDNLYVDLDDTLVIKNRVNPDAMRCLYKYSSMGVPIHLITRRHTNISEYLRKFHIPGSIFTSIRQVMDMSSKSLYIAPNSVFVDDSFREREQCSCPDKNIRSFDVDSFSYL